MKRLPYTSWKIQQTTIDIYFLHKTKQNDTSNLVSFLILKCNYFKITRGPRCLT